MSMDIDSTVVATEDTVIRNPKGQGQASTNENPLDDAIIEQSDEHTIPRAHIAQSIDLLVV